MFILIVAMAVLVIAFVTGDTIRRVRVAKRDGYGVAAVASPTFEWPVGRVQGVAADSRGIHFVPVPLVSRIQIHEKSSQSHNDERKPIFSPDDAAKSSKGDESAFRFVSIPSCPKFDLPERWGLPPRRQQSSAIELSIEKFER